jgi:hypothetical protein
MKFRIFQLQRVSQSACAAPLQANTVKDFSQKRPEIFRKILVFNKNLWADEKDFDKGADAYGCRKQDRIICTDGSTTMSQTG